MCEISYIDCPKSNMTSLSECDHPFCNECWAYYLTNKITSDGVGLNILCPDPSCKVLVPMDTVTGFIGKDATKTYKRLISESFVTSNRLMKWCPGKDCSNAIKVKMVEEKATLCNCGYLFCFSCTANWHAPVTCDILKKWLKRCEEDSETAKWLNNNTKECPKCYTTINKYDGCNRVVCGKCSFQFCWSCLKDWDVHGYGKSMENAWKPCVKFDEKDDSDEHDSRAALKNYMFYYERYMTHSDSFKLLSKLKEKVDTTRKSLQTNMSYIETQFVLKAWEALGESRRVLMHTYI